MVLHGLTDHCSIVIDLFHCDIERSHIIIYGIELTIKLIAVVGNVLTIIGIDHQACIRIDEWVEYQNYVEPGRGEFSIDDYTGIHIVATC